MLWHGVQVGLTSLLPPTSFDDTLSQTADVRPAHIFTSGGRGAVGGKLVSECCLHVMHRLVQEFLMLEKKSKKHFEK